MTSRTTIGEPGAESQVRIDVADSVISQWSLTLTAQKLSLEQLSPAANGAKWITGDDER
jgi:hypothetical protein